MMVETCLDGCKGAVVTCRDRSAQLCDGVFGKIESRH